VTTSSRHHHRRRRRSTGPLDGVPSSPVRAHTRAHPCPCALLTCSRPLNPAGFTLSSADSFDTAFERYVQLLASAACDPDFLPSVREAADPYFVPALERVDADVRVRQESLASSAWEPAFRVRLQGNARGWGRAHRAMGGAAAAVARSGCASARQDSGGTVGRHVLRRLSPRPPYGHSRTAAVRPYLRSQHVCDGPWPCRCTQVPWLMRCRTGGRTRGSRRRRDVSARPPLCSARRHVSPHAPLPTCAVPHRGARSQGMAGDAWMGRFVDMALIPAHGQELQRLHGSERAVREIIENEAWLAQARGHPLTHMHTHACARARERAHRPTDADRRGAVGGQRS
jgi:hypothetical protein